MSFGAVKNKIVNPRCFYAFIIVALICIYHMFFIRSTIPAQIGWWQYIGWRLNEGDILYKDIYCHVQPFFPWFVSILYKFWGSNFIFYIIPGLMIRIIETLLVYSILLKITKPAIAAFISFFSIIYTISAMYDIVFDYNTTILFITVLEAYVFAKFYEYYDIRKKHNLYCILSGVIAGIHFLSKQNTGTIVPFAVFVLLIIITLNKDGKSRLIDNIGRFVFGAFIVFLPTVIYILATNAFPDYIHCVIFGMSSKGSMLAKINNIINNMLNVYDIIITMTIIIMIYLRYHISSVSKKIYYIINFYLLFITVWCIQQRFNNAFHGLCEILKMSPEKIYFLILSILIAILIAIKYKKICKMIQKKKAGIYIAGIFISLIFTMILFCWFNKPEIFHSTIFYALDFQVTRTYLVYIVHYFFYAFWIINTYQIIKKKNVDIEVYVFITIIVAFNLSAFLGSTPEEFTILPTVAFVLVQLFTRRTIFNSVKNTLLVYCSLVFILICFSQKMFMPYTWHGWSDVAIEKNNLVPSAIVGLKGYLLPDSTEEKYELIVNTILENSSENDTVYQFPNITLFNVLTHRKIPTYMPVHYFDVCSDETAISDAEYLTNNLPKIILWAELGEASWNVHEQLFRGGARSGQRALQDFYNTTVHEKYQLAVSVDNNQGNVIEVWVLNQ